MTTYRRAWTMALNDGAEEAYDAAHAAVWPELQTQMVSDGIERYLIWRTGTTVVAYQERSTPFPVAPRDPSPLTLRWWRKMAPLMRTDPDGRPVHTDLREVFALLPQKEPAR